jgi:ribosomal protein S18 acetylase RimI-like enzyme
MIDIPIEAGKNRGIETTWPEEVCYSMKFLDSSHLEEVKELQDIAARNLPDKEIFRLTTVQEFKELLEQQKSVIGVHADHRLIAYNIASIPREDEDNFGADIGIPQLELKKVAHIKAVVVHPNFRGRGLQRKLARIHLEVLRYAAYEHVCSTVSPKNCISVKNHLANGFVIKGLKVKYGGWLRYIMYKNISKSFHLTSKAVAVVSTDIEQQKDWLNRGYVGYELKRSNNRQAETYSINFGLACYY